MDASPPPSSGNGLQLSWFGRGSTSPGAALEVAPASDVSVTADVYRSQSTAHKGNFSRVLLGSSLFPVTAIMRLLFGPHLS